MFSSFRNRFGIPGVISVIALVFAMLGGAYAASNSGDSKDAAASAKKKSAKGPRGPKGATGPAGPAGAPGAKGDTGAAGANGANGSNGATGATGANGTNGQSVTTEEIFVAEDCGDETGVMLKSVSGEDAICNGEDGEDGSPWTVGGTLPAGETLSGSWAVGILPNAGDQAWISASFNIPLPADLPADNAHFIDQNGKEVVFNGTTFEVEELASHPNCAGTSVSPTAAPGHFCLYAADEVGLKNSTTNEESGLLGSKPGGFTLSSFHKAENGPNKYGVSQAGAIIQVIAQQSGAVANGTWTIRADPRAAH
jgi:Collagen triple helix repeat (20 copies)